MPTGSSENITELLGRWRAGDEAAGEALVREVYPVLQKLAAAQVRRHDGGTLRATEIVNEAYLKLKLQDRVEWQSRAHFFAIAATVMRRVLIDHLRDRQRPMHGGGIRFVPHDSLGEDEQELADDPINWLSLDQALSELEQTLPALAKVVELRLFGGLESEEIAQATGTSTATVGRQWRFAKAWLADRLEIDLDDLGR